LFWYLKRLLQLRFDFDSTRQSGHHDSKLMLMKAWIHTRRHFTSEVCEWAIPTSTSWRMLSDVDPSAWMSFLSPWRTLLRHYMPRPLPYWKRRFSTRRKNEHSFFVVVESKPNRSCNSRLSWSLICSVRTFN